MRKAFHAFGFILYCGDIVFQLAMIQVCHRQRSEWSCQCGACHVGEQGGHGTTLLQNVEAEGVTIGMFGRSCVIANYRSPSSMHENKDELKGGWGHWFFLAGLDLPVHALHSCIELQYVPSNSCPMCGLLFPIVYFQWHGEAHVEKIRSLFSQLGAEKTGVITYAMKLGWSKPSSGPFVWGSHHAIKQCTRFVMHMRSLQNIPLIQLNVFKKSLSDHPNCLIAPNHAKPSRMILRNHAAKLANALSETTNSDRTSHVWPCSAILLGDTNHEWFTCWTISRSSAVLGASIQCDG